MFYDLPAPNDFVQDVGSILADDGIWILEMSYLPRMVERNSFDTICHEHLEYYPLKQIVDLTQRHGLRVFDVLLNDVQRRELSGMGCAGPVLRTPRITKS